MHGWIGLDALVFFESARQAVARGASTSLSFADEPCPASPILDPAYVSVSVSFFMIYHAPSYFFTRMNLHRYDLEVNERPGAGGWLKLKPIAKLNPNSINQNSTLTQSIKTQPNPNSNFDGYRPSPLVTGTVAGSECHCSTLVRGMHHCTTPTTWQLSAVSPRGLHSSGGGLGSAACTATHLLIC